MSDLDDRLASLSPERRALLEEMMARQASAEPARLPERPRLEPAPGERHRPFPLTPAQQAFWIGRSGLYDLGGGGANSYMEYEFSNAGAAFIDRLEWAFQEFVERHDMMRAVVLADGRQQVLDEVLPIRISRINLRGKPEPEAEAALAESRERLRSDPGRLAEWPLFDLVAFYLDGDRVRLQLRFEALLKDGRSRGLLIDELPALFADPDAALEPIGITYRDFAVATEALPDGALHRRCRDYWAERWDDLPPGPLLPLVADLGPSSVARQTSRAGVLLETEAWRQLRQRAARMGLSASGVVLAAFVEVVTAFSEEPRFTLAVLSMGRPELHDDLDQVFGNFNTFVPLACDRGGGTFAERARRLQRQLGDHLEHGHFSGPEILREINRRRPSSMARWPVVFNSVLDTSRAEPIFDPEGEVWTDPSVVGDEGDSGDGGIRMTEIEGSVHTPQSLLTLTAMEAGDDLHGRWASFDEALPPGLVDAMDGALRSLLETLAESEGPWRLAVPPLQIAARGAEPVETADALGALREALGDDLVGPVAILAAPGSALAMVAEALVRAAGLELAPGPAAARLVFAQPARVGELFAGDDVAGSPIARVVLGDGEIPLGLPRRLARRLGATVSWLAPLSPSVALWNPDLAAALTDDAVRLERGRPLGGRLRVSDAAGRERPDRVPGRLEVKPPDGPAVETGWLALRHPDGEIELLGSSESHRLELAGGRRVERRRVEAVLERQEGVAGAAVVAREDGDGRRRAVAFVTATDGADLDPDQLAGALSEGLPPALRPSAVEVVETLPLDARGRVDRAALARRAQADAASAPTPRPPEGELETELAGLWEKLLGERPASVTDSLFDLGGTSLTLARLQALLAERYGTDVPLAAFFDRPTLGHLAEMVEERRAQMAAARRAVGPLTWLRRRLAGEPAPAATAAATPGLATPPVSPRRRAPPAPPAPPAPRAPPSMTCPPACAPSCSSGPGSSSPSWAPAWAASPWGSGSSSRPSRPPCSL
jgi:acyl carrier protein